MTLWFRPALVALAVLVAPAHATVYDLGADFSDAANPNGPWSFTYGAPLAHYPQPTTPNALNGAAANGYWGTGADFFTAPFLIRTTADGSAVGYGDGDFLAGDVIVHGPNDGSAVLVNWTAPSDGSIDLAASLWYAHSVVARSQDIVVTLGGTVLDSVTVTNGIGRDGALPIDTTGLAVAAGDVLSFAFSKSAGQTFGSLAGISAIVDFTPTATPPVDVVPEPATWAMMIGGFAMAGCALRRRGRVTSIA